MTKAMIKSRKAISPILATLLLIVIAVAAIVVTYAWIMTYMSNAGQQAGVMLYKVNVSFYLDSGTPKINVDIGNRGTSNTQIMQVYVGNSPSTMQNQTTTPALPVVLAAGTWARVTVSYPWTASSTYYFKVVSSSGQTLETWPEQAPAS